MQNRACLCLGTTAHICDAAAAIKRAIRNEGDRGGNGKALDAAAVVKCSSLDGGDGGGDGEW